MKVLHVYRTYYPDQPSGIAEAIRQTCLSTRPLGVQSTIFALSPRPWQKHNPAPEAHVERARSWIAPASCDIGGLEAFRKFAMLARGSDVIHYHYPWPFGDIMHFAVKPAAPAVMTWHSDVVRQKLVSRLYRPLMNAMLQKISLIAATSPAYARTSDTLARRDIRDRVRVVPLGIDKSFVPREAGDTILRRLGVTGPFILFVGAMRYYKGLTFLLEAARCSKIPLVLAGGGPELPALRRLAAGKGLENVMFAGHVSEADKMELLRACRALVLPSHLRSEAYGVVLVEAAMCGKPMICCEIGTGTSYVNLHGVTGLVVPPRDPEALAHAMSRLVDSEELASSLGAAARRRYEEQFSGEAMGSNHLAFYEEAVSAGRKQGSRNTIGSR